MPSSRNTQLLARTILVFAILGAVFVSGRSAHYGDPNQINQEQESGSNMINSGLTPLQLEILSQRLSEYNNQIPQVPAAWYRISNPEVKRQNSYRQCFFNPISCFGK